MRGAPGHARTGLLLVALSAVAFGTLAIFGKLAGRRGIPLSELLGLRFSLAAVVLWTLAALRGERLWWGRRALGLALMGGLYVIQAAFYFSSLRTVPAAVTSILLYLYPVFVVVLARLLLHEPLSRGRVVALTLAMAGVVLVVDPLGAARHLTVAGVVLGLGSGVTYSLYIVSGPRLLRDIPAVVGTAHIASVAGACFLTIAAVHGGLVWLDRGGLALTAGMAVLATVIPASLFLAGLRRIGPSRAAIVSTFEPVTTAVLAALILGEVLTPIQLGGGAAVLAAAVLIARTRPRLAAESAIRE